MFTVSETPIIKQIVVFGFGVLLAFFGGFFLWSSLAPIETAAVSVGKIIVDTNRKTIQHLEGGIVKNILVRDGSQVRTGDPLIYLENTQAQASYQLLYQQVNDLLATEARLIAERDELKTIEFPKRLLEAGKNPKIKKIMTVQQSLFVSNQKTFDTRLSILNQRIEQLKKEIESLDAQVASEKRQLELIQEEIEAVAYLEARKLIDKPRLLALKREKARLNGDKGEHLGLIARAKQRIGETQTQLIGLIDLRKKETLEDLTETRKRLNDVLEREKSAEDVFKRSIIKSPIDGTVVNLKEHTQGGVLRPGEDIMEIVPINDKLVIEARFSPLDIDIVKKGLLAKVRLTAYKQRYTPTLEGKVVDVSADALEDPKTGGTFYLARIEINKTELAALKRIKLYPGMPAQVMIITERRTPIAYFLTPIKESFYRAFREQ